MPKKIEAEEAKRVQFSLGLIDRFNDEILWPTCAQVAEHWHQQGAVLFLPVDGEDEEPTLVLRKDVDLRTWVEHGSRRAIGAVLVGHGPGLHVHADIQCVPF